MSRLPPGCHPLEVACCRHYLARVESTEYEPDVAVTLQEQTPEQPESLAVLGQEWHEIETGGQRLREGDLLELWTYLELHPEGAPVIRVYARLMPRPTITETERQELSWFE